jgi:hypothetical protein
MPWLGLTTVDTAELRDLPEVGMGFHIVSAVIEGELQQRTFQVVTARQLGRDVTDRYTGYIAVPDSHGTYYSLSDLLEGQPLDLFEQPVVRSLSRISAFTTRNVAALPAGYVPVVGARPLLGSVILAQPRPFYRYVGSLVDPRFDGKNLAKDTYLTSYLDQHYANTGFGAVGRYALPLPVPASHVIQYILPAGASLLVGTATPSFGQAGGGVEVQLVNAVAPLVAISGWIDDF